MASPFAVVSLRGVLDSDLPIFFEHQRDPEATRMANFPARARDAFFAHWAKIRVNPDNIIQTVLYNGQVAGNFGCWPAEEKRLIGYWIGREFWNRGIATAALREFVKVVPHRPLHAYVAKQNIGSIRVLEKSGFKICTKPSPTATQAERVCTKPAAQEHEPDADEDLLYQL